MAGNRKKHRRSRQRVGAVRLVPRKREKIDADQVAMVYWLLANRIVRDRRAREAVSTTASTIRPPGTRLEVIVGARAWATTTTAWPGAELRAEPGP